MKNAEITAALNVEIPNRLLALSLLERWSESGVTLKIVRGRVTLEEARYELEIQGAAAKVATIVRQSAPWDIHRRFLNPVPTGASA